MPTAANAVPISLRAMATRAATVATPKIAIAKGMMDATATNPMEAAAATINSQQDDNEYAGW